MRERLARLETVERPAGRGRLRRRRLRRLAARRRRWPTARRAGSRSPAARARDQLVELGAGNLIPGFEEGLLGAGAGETRTVALTLPRRLRQRASWPAATPSFEVTVKEVKRKELPEVDEDFAVDAGFDDLEELREDIRRRLLEATRSAIEAEFREAALDAAVAQRAACAVTPELVKARAREMWERMLHSLVPPRHLARGLPADHRARGGGDPRRDGARSRAGAAPRGGDHRGRRRRGHRRRPRRSCWRRSRRPPSARASSREQAARASCATPGAWRRCARIWRRAQAIDLIAAAAKPIPLAQAQAREQLWTPEKAARASAERRRGAGRRAPAAAVDTGDRGPAASLLEESGRRGETKARTMRRKRGL